MKLQGLKLERGKQIEKDSYRESDKVYILQSRGFSRAFFKNMLKISCYIKISKSL